MKNLFFGLLPDSFVQKRYIEAGRIFGDALSYLHYGESGNMERLLKKLERWEEEYTRRGFKPISLKKFADFGGWGIPIDDVAGIKREPEEEQMLYSELYREKCLGKVKPIVNLDELM